MRSELIKYHDNINLPKDIPSFYRKIISTMLLVRRALTWILRYEGLASQKYLYFLPPNAQE